MPSRNLPPALLSLCYALTIAGAIVSPALAQFPVDSKPAEELLPGFETMTAEQSEQWLSILAGPGFEGRGTGQQGYVKAAHWVAGKVAEFGLEPVGENGTYFQMLPMSRLVIDEAQSGISGPNDFTMQFQGNVGLARFSSEPETSGKLAFVRLVGDRPNMEASLLEGKIVIYKTDEANAGRAAFVLGRQRPALLLQVSDQAVQSTPQLQRPNRGGRRSIYGGQITRNAAMQLIELAQGESAWLEESDDAKFEAHATETEINVSIRTYEEPAAVPNVLAWIPGSDESVRDEYVVVGAHLDHLGTRGDEVYPGADDNGSGSTALLNIARAIATNEIKPRRSVLLMWFAAEEMGLVGSAYYCDNPLLPIDKMICMLNIDMVGRNEEKNGETAEENQRSIHLVGSKKGDTDLHDIILEANRHVGFEFEYDEEGVFGRSDQANFFRKGTSVAFMFGGFHPDYHRPTDVPAKINYNKIAAAARLYYLTVYAAGEHGDFDPETQKNQNSRTQDAAETDSE